MKFRWRPTLSDEPLWPSESPVVMVVTKAGSMPRASMGWALGSRALSPMCETGREMSGERDVVNPGGHVILRQAVLPNPHFDSYPDPYWAPQHIRRVTVSTGEMATAGFDARANQDQSSVLFGGSPDGQAVVIAELWSDPEPDPRRDYENFPGAEQARRREEYELRQRAANRVTISIATFDGAPSREIATLNALQFQASDASGIQWSPDGRLVAVSLLYGTEWDQQIHVFDTARWETVAVFRGARLSGSASWGPDSDRLLFEGPGDRCWIQHLDGTRQLITVIPPTDASGLRPTRPIGMADNDHLLTLRTPRNTATIMRTSIADGTHEGLLTWTDQPYMYPVIAQMPPETWA